MHGEHPLLWTFLKIFCLLASQLITESSLFFGWSEHWRSVEVGFVDDNNVPREHICLAARLSSSFFLRIKSLLSWGMSTKMYWEIASKGTVIGVDAAKGSWYRPAGCRKLWRVERSVLFPSYTEVFAKTRTGGNFVWEPCYLPGGIILNPLWDTAMISQHWLFN